MHIYLHKLELLIDNEPLANDAYRISFAPQVEREMPSQMEIELVLPAKSTLTYRVPFSRSLLRVDEFPPDKYRGIDLRYAVSSFRLGLQ